MIVTRFWAIVLALLMVLSACGKQQQGAASDVQRPGGYAAGTQVTHGWQLPPTTLTDEDGKPFVLNQPTTDVTLVFFGFSNCDDECPATLADLAAALKGLDENQRAKVSVWLISVDPDRDKPAVLKSYLARFNPSFVGLTGPLATIESVGKIMKVDVEKPHDHGGKIEIDHGLQVIGYGVDHRAQVVWSYGTSVADLTTDISSLVAKQG